MRRTQCARRHYAASERAQSHGDGALAVVCASLKILLWWLEESEQEKIATCSSGFAANV